jgi:hypothetical protein
MRVGMVRRLLGGVALVGVLAACSSSGPAAKPFQTGNYQIVGHIPSDGLLQFRDDKTFSVISNGAQATSGTYSISGNVISYATDSYCKANGQESATYTWKWDGTKLTFAAKGTDKCSGRITTMSNEWTPLMPPSIPQSAAIDAITKDLTTPAAADLVAKCSVYAAAFKGNVAGGHDTEVFAALKSLADVVRPIDPAVADALAGHGSAAADWCMAKGLTKN